MNYIYFQPEPGEKDEPVSGVTDTRTYLGKDQRTSCCSSETVQRWRGEFLTRGGEK